MWAAEGVGSIVANDFSWSPYYLYDLNAAINRRIVVAVRVWAAEGVRSIVANDFSWSSDYLSDLYELLYASIISPWDRETVSILHARQSSLTARER